MASLVFWLLGWECQKVTSSFQIALRWVIRMYWPRGELCWQRPRQDQHKVSIAEFAEGWVKWGQVSCMLSSEISPTHLWDFLPGVSLSELIKVLLGEVLLTAKTTNGSRECLSPSLGKQNYLVILEKGRRVCYPGRENSGWPQESHSPFSGCNSSPKTTVRWLSSIETWQSWERGLGIKESREK